MTPSCAPAATAWIVTRDARPFASRVGPQSRADGRRGLDAVHRALGSDELCGEEREVADVGTDVHEDITGPHGVLHEAREVGLPHPEEVEEALDDIRCLAGDPADSGHIRAGGDRVVAEAHVLGSVGCDAQRRRKPIQLSRCSGRASQAATRCARGAAGTSRRPGRCRRRCSARSARTATVARAARRHDATRPRRRTRLRP